MTDQVPKINGIAGNDQQQPFNGENKKIAPAVLAAIISGVGSLASAGISYFSNRNANRVNRETMQMQNAFNSMEALKAFNRETSYNNPEAAMARLVAAGINPNMVTGDMPNTANSSSATSGGSIPMQPFNPMLQFSQDFLNLAQARNIDAQTDMIPEQREKLIAEVKSIMQQNELAKVTIGKIQADTELDYSQMDMIAKQCEQITQNVENMKQDVKESQARIRKIDSDIKLNGVNSRYVKAMTLALNNQNSLWEYEKGALMAQYDAATQEATLSARQIKENMDLLLKYFKTSLEADNLEAFNRERGAELITTNSHGRPLQIFGASILSRWLTGNANGSAVLGAARGSASDALRLGVKLLK